MARERPSQPISLGFFHSAITEVQTDRASSSAGGLLTLGNVPSHLGHY
jgi:hypothetical protein